MVEKLHKIDELDQYCLPIRPERPVIIDDTSDDEETEKVPIEMIDKQVSTPYSNLDIIADFFLFCQIVCLFPS